MAAGLTRIIEISFILRDKNTLVGPEGGDVDLEINSFQYLPIFLLYASGFLFMGATEEQMAMLAGAHVTHVSYILILYSLAFLLFLCKYTQPIDHLKASMQHLLTLIKSSLCSSTSTPPTTTPQTRARNPRVLATEIEIFRRFRMGMRAAIAPLSGRRAMCKMKTS